MISHQLEQDGYYLLPAIYRQDEVCQVKNDLLNILSQDQSEAVRRSDAGHVFAARNILDLWPRARDIWRRPQLDALLKCVLGSDFGLVRGLYFDKPPEHTWSLPWHKDMSLAVKNNRLPSQHFNKPTTKVGVPHVEGSEAILQRMLTLRIHLDPATLDNGVLHVLPGSHRHGKMKESDNQAAVPVLADAGDVLAIRPLVSHCSGKSNDGTLMHRRILHLEFAADRELPDGYEWRWFFN